MFIGKGKGGERGRGKEIDPPWIFRKCQILKFILNLQVFVKQLDKVLPKIAKRLSYTLQQQ